MILIAFIALGPMQQLNEVTEIIEDELLIAPGFVLRGVSSIPRPSSFIINGSSARQSDGASILLDAKKIKETIDPAIYWVSTGPAAISSEPALGFSDLPIGQQARRGAGGGAATLSAYDGRVFVDARVVYRGRPANGEPEWISSDPNGDKTICEGLTRRTLARVRGLKAQITTNVSVAGSAVGAVNGPRGERLVDLQHYCQALNLQLSTNGNLGTASFTAGGEQVVIPLAAKKIKDGARWIDTNDISLIKDGKWYVSYAALQEARGH